MKNWIKRLLGRKQEIPKPIFREVKDDNNVHLYDQQTVDYMESQLPNATQQKLSELLAKAEQIIISKSEIDQSKKEKIPINMNGTIIEVEGSPMVLVKICEISDPQELQIAKKHFEIHDHSHGHLMCAGDYQFNFIDMNGNAVEIEYLAYGNIRIEKHFKDDAILKKPLEFLNWLNAMGISEPLEMWKANEK